MQSELLACTYALAPQRENDASIRYAKLTFLRQNNAVVQHGVGDTVSGCMFGRQSDRPEGWQKHTISW